MAARTDSYRRRWYQRGRAVYAAFEWGIMRVLFAWVLYGSFRLAGYDALRWSTSPGRGFAAQPNERGIAQFFDVTWITDPANIPWFCGALAVGLVVFVSGVAPFLSSLLLLWLQTLIGTLENSQGGNVFHTSQILAFVLLGVCLGAVYDSIQGLAKGGIRGWLAVQVNRWRWLPHLLNRPRALFARGSEQLEQWTEKSRSRTIYVVQQVIAASYVVSGITKLWRSEGKWLSEVKNIGLQMVKNDRNDYYDTLQGSTAVPPAVEWVYSNLGLATVFFAMGLLMELTCFVALFNRVFLAVYGVALIAMHYFIAQLMSLYFGYYQWVLFAFFVNVPFWLMLAKRRLLR